MEPTAPSEPALLCLDIETDRHDRLKLREIGLYRPDTGARLKLSGQDRSLVAKVDALTDGATGLLGHNIIAFDQPALSVLHPDLALHRLPLIDTLELSPIAFPRNPYHKLVKDYRLCTTSRNDPVRDAELAYQLFRDEYAALKARAAESPDELLCLHALMGGEENAGLARIFRAVRHSAPPSLEETVTAWTRATADQVCLTAHRRLITDWLPDPAWRKPLAYTLAWLGVAGGNSVLPSWVRHAFPKTGEAIAALRDRPCDDPACAWCREQHDLDRLLPLYFPGITRFRTKPATPDGRSLQRAIVENGFGGRPTLAILPTGGGKSLCFQLPALARYERTGALTVVISPLQSLMKDQVDNLIARGLTCAGYLNGMLTPIERRAMLDRLRLGDLGLIFVAPEQFRSTAFAQALSHREIAAWIFDEAHCLSKWGHDFRPDYLYVSKFIKATQKDRCSPVFGFTATAKPDVVDDIAAHFRERLGLELDRLEGGVSRDNLVYEVHAVPAQAKLGEVLRRLKEALREEGGAIIFCARQKTAQETAEFLTQAGIDCAYFHGGLDSDIKRAVQEDFIAGRRRVIAATNAFGMGVDKPDVRLVIHLDTPGSLENYIQEAGRAGRDQEPAQCVLLYDDADLDIQFNLLKRSRLSQNDIRAILKAIRAIERKDRSEGEVVVTTGEILLETPESHRIEADDRQADTKVRIAIAWLEEARLLERQENHTRVFPGSLRVTALDEAVAILRKRLGPQTEIAPYEAILRELIEAGDDESRSTDDLMLATGLDSRRLRAMLRELDQWGLLANETEIGVTLYRDPATRDRLDELTRLETALIAQLREAAPDADQDEGWQILNVRRLCDTLRRETHTDLDPQRLTRLLKSFAEAFGDGDGDGQRAFLKLRPAGADNRYIKLLRPWSSIELISERRRRFAQALVEYVYRVRQGNNLQVVFKQRDLEDSLKGDLTLQDLEIKDWDRALSSALLYLDANEVLKLSRGKALFRSAMNITLNSEARRRQFSKGDYAELDLHYRDKIVQVHVMGEYARLGAVKVQAAMQFIADYFRLERGEFIRRHFAGRKEILEIATSEAAHRRILVDLRNPAQQAIVAAPPEGSLLVLAGPGSGKTRVIVHRVAWLLRQGMAHPQDIMVLAYNRSAVSEIRHRLWALVGPEAVGVSVQTVHGLAMRLTGTSYAVALERGEKIDFTTVLRQATARLKQAEREDVSESTERDRLLAGLRFLLIDEYQDINGEHYDLISAVAGRALDSEEDRLSLMAVGDDDQNIYAFGGADMRFIRQFETDYQARRHQLIENYRSTRHIIACSNRVIAPARDRMKTDEAIRIDHARRERPAGGDLEERDPVTGGRVQVLDVSADPRLEAQIALAELQRLYAVEDTTPEGRWGRFAVIARQWKDLEPLAALCRRRGVPVRLLRDDHQPDLHRTREGHGLLDLLRGEQRRTAKRRVLVRARTLSRWFRRRYGLPVDGLIEHPFRAALAQFIAETESAAPEGRRVVEDLIEALYEFGSGGRTMAESRANGPMVLMTAHRAKGLEFDHVLILDGGGWSSGDDERRLYYVAMTRARRSLTLCERLDGRHPFVRATEGLALRTRPTVPELEPGLDHRIWVADPSMVYLDWPGRFAPNAPIHRALAALEVGDPLELRPMNRRDGQPGWELGDRHGVVVARMAAKFQPPVGEIVTVRVAAVLVRTAKGDEGLRCERWELVLAEIEYRDTN
ncbi:ATP-dependent DNA helicase, RecQ family (plasmid) [Allochromatium vinosum DSM 180]|uniref:DNA 3'-5' helicase n=2 Tax=Allochromatium vinosum TaxID=1049 RepID=D3RW64_ALLVD|nr:ATP-dependent DNA helicase, RecQ family [Allochromatium vinosum DSM 180]